MKHIITALLLTLSAVAVHAQTAIPGQANFFDTTVTTVGAPTALAFTPDGRMLIATQGGSLRVYQGGTLLATPAITFNTSSMGSEPKICNDGERGLLGVAVDPLFATNNYVYLFYTARNNNASCQGGANYSPGGSYNAANLPVNRVSRFTLGGNNLIAPATELILIDRMPSRGTNHNAGDIHFGKDGYLYISIGDGGQDYNGSSGGGGSNDAARDKHILTGKILRIASDGSIPPSNPFQGGNTARCNVLGANPTVGEHCQETFAWGLRNPFRFAMDPNAAATRFYINDVGQDSWEEIDEGASAADYGWNCREGAHVNNTGGPCSPTPGGMIDPVFEYAHSSNALGSGTGSCESITGGAFVPNGVWPAGFDNKYFFADYVCGGIFYIPTSGTRTPVAFITGLGSSSATSLTFGPDGAGQALYYTSYNSGGQVHKITYAPAGNNAPTVTALTATPGAGAIPLNVNLSATATDPNGNPLTYFWDFGDGSTATTTLASTAKSYPVAGVYTVTVRARDSNFAFSNAFTTTVQAGNTAPTVEITSPLAAYEFTVGESITLTATATDAQDGALANGARSWRVILHHDIHTHPFLGPVTGNNLTFVAPAPEDLAAAANSYLEIELTVTDSGGLQTVVTQNLMPKKVTLSFATLPQPQALATRFSVAGTAKGQGDSAIAWAGWALPLDVRDQNRGIQGFVFNNWTHGGSRMQNYIVPATSATITANFTVGNFVPSLDADNDGSYAAATDGVLIMRYLLGFRGSALTANAVALVGAERGDAVAIADYLDAILGSLDIDGDSNVWAYTDGALIVRHLLGLSDVAMTSNVSVSGFRNAAQMLTHLNGLRP